MIPVKSLFLSTLFANSALYVNKILLNSEKVQFVYQKLNTKYTLGHFNIHHSYIPQLPWDTIVKV